jgi:hypothetical protein
MHLSFYYPAVNSVNILNGLDIFDMSMHTRICKANTKKEEDLCLYSSFCISHDK